MEWDAFVQQRNRRQHERDPHTRSPQIRCCQRGIRGKKQKTDNRQQLIPSGGRDFTILMRYKLENRQKDNRHQWVEIYVLRRI